MAFMGRGEAEKTVFACVNVTERAASLVLGHVAFLLSMWLCLRHDVNEQTQDTHSRKSAASEAE